MGFFDGGEGASDGALFEGTLIRALLKALFVPTGESKKRSWSNLSRLRILLSEETDRRPSWPLQRNCSQKDAGETYF